MKKFYKINRNSYLHKLLIKQKVQLERAKTINELTLKNEIPDAEFESNNRNKNKSTKNKFENK